MTVRGRYWLAAVSGILWVAWLILLWLAVSPQHASTAPELFAEGVVRVAAVVTTLTTVLMCAVSPFVATARVYMRIGEMEERARHLEQQEYCACEQERQVANCVVIPIRPARRSFSDN